VVPVEFLTDVQAEAYGRFVGPPSRRELDGFFFLDDADLRMVGRRRGDHNRLGFGVQLATVRYLGMFLADPLDVPGEAGDCIAAQLGVDVSCLAGYAAREKTRLEHQWEIAHEFGYRDFANAERELAGATALATGLALDQATRPAINHLLDVRSSGFNSASLQTELLALIGVLIALYLFAGFYQSVRRSQTTIRAGLVGA
jgi:hypothetical protein